jgi:hypothetical protein
MFRDALSRVLFIQFKKRTTAFGIIDPPQGGRGSTMEQANCQRAALNVLICADII